MQAIYRLMRSIGSSWISIAGANIAAVAAATVFLLAGLMTFGGLDNAYLGILAFVLLPAAFFVGLLLIPIGIFRGRRRTTHGATAPGPRFPIVDFNVPRVRQTAMLVVLLTIVNIGLSAAFTYKGVEFTESPAFCGATCHTPMEPQYAAFKDSVHQSITCAECHIGEGARGFLAAKFSGVRQLYEVATNSYPRPIPTHRENMPSLVEACTHCHSPERQESERFLMRTKYLDDELNTPTYTALVLKLGSIEDDTGIHGWHNRPGRTIEYLPGAAASDPVKAVRVTQPSGETKEYVLADAGTDGQWQEMTCIDCHNRVGHRFLPPTEAVDHAIESGIIDRSLPYVRSTVVAALTAMAAKEKVTSLEAFYSGSYADIVTEKKASITSADVALQQIANRNYFEAMNVSWETYPNHRGHTESLGCFRCHDEAHTAPDGQVIRQDCAMCHNVLAWDEESPEALKQMGLLR